jgi:hypothetical protein
MCGKGHCSPLRDRRHAEQDDIILWALNARQTHIHIHIPHTQNDIHTVLKVAISMNKRRFVDESANINLDLTYVCDRMIAMALPCVADAIYRNNILDVAQFFSSRHYGRYVYVSVCLSIYLSFYLSVYISIHVSIFVSIYVYSDMQELIYSLCSFNLCTYVRICVCMATRNI